MRARGNERKTESNTEKCTAVTERDSARIERDDAAAAAQSRVAVIIPTYNNAPTIAGVIADVLRYTADVVVVNDGSTDATAKILQDTEGIRVLSLPFNQGKGCALAEGFRYAAGQGFTHAITFDADGQHLAVDLPAFLEKIRLEPAALWVGNRTMPCDGAIPPRRSRWGRHFGNFWYRVITGVRLDDTQCGLRAYPLAVVSRLKTRGQRYEYEQELLIKSAWSGTPVRQINIHLYYQDRATRVSYFRPVRDFLRISRVNGRHAFMRCVLPLSSLAQPGDSIREKIVHLVKHELQAHTSPGKAAFSVSLGVFFGLSPLYGFQVLSVVVLSLLLRLNRPLALLGVCVSPPPLMPFLAVAGVAIGRMVLPDNLVSIQGHATGTAFAQGALEFAIGSVIMAIAGSLLSFVLLYPVFKKLVPAIKRWRRAQS
jgi:glycosyltransferase involved in cell wall biosynthesis